MTDGNAQPDEPDRQCRNAVFMLGWASPRRAVIGVVGGLALTLAMRTMVPLFNGVVLDRMLHPSSATFVVRLNLPNPNRAILGGVRCSAEISGVTSPADAPRAGAKPAP